jgi:hypothetical protein
MASFGNATDLAAAALPLLELVRRHGPMVYGTRRRIANMARTPNGGAGAKPARDGWHGGGPGFKGERLTASVVPACCC